MIIRILYLTSIIIILFSCSNKKAGKDVTLENIVENNYYQTLPQPNLSKGVFYIFISFALYLTISAINLYGIGFLYRN